MIRASVTVPPKVELETPFLPFASMADFFITSSMPDDIFMAKLSAAWWAWMSTSCSSLLTTSCASTSLKAVCISSESSSCHFKCTARSCCCLITSAYFKRITTLRWSEPICQSHECWWNFGSIRGVHAHFGPIVKDIITLQYSVQYSFALACCFNSFRTASWNLSQLEWSNTGKFQ